MREVEGRNDVGGCGDDLVAIAVEVVVVVGGAGHAVAAAAASTVADVAHRAVFGIETVPSWIVHELAVVADAEVLEVAWVVVEVAAAVVAVVGAEVAGLAQVAAVTTDVVGVASAVVACYLAFGVDWVVVVAVGGLRLLWLRYRGRIAVSNS